jgi:hypothetical protein
MSNDERRNLSPIRDKQDDEASPTNKSSEKKIVHLSVRQIMENSNGEAVAVGNYRKYVHR